VRRVELPTSGTLQGIVTIIQEDRFRLVDAAGRGYLFTLGRHAGLSISGLHDLRARRQPVQVEYDGPPDLGGVAVRVRKQPP
jgi:hypothetical protein